MKTCPVLEALAPRGILCVFVLAALFQGLAQPSVTLDRIPGGSKTGAWETDDSFVIKISSFYQEAVFQSKKRTITRQPRTVGSIEAIVWFMRSRTASGTTRAAARTRWFAALLFFGSVCLTEANSGIETAGDILQFVLPGAAAGLTLVHRDWDGALQFGESAGLTLGTTYLLKYTVNETRPNGGSQSFPSGHTSISFSAAEYMRKRYGLEYGIPAYGLASFVAYSRVEAGQHHPHDVIAGAAIGIVSSYIFTKPYKGWQIEPLADGKWYGFRVTRKF